MHSLWEVGLQESKPLDVKVYASQRPKNWNGPSENEVGGAFMEIVLMNPEMRVTGDLKTKRS